MLYKDYLDQIAEYFNSNPEEIDVYLRDRIWHGNWKESKKPKYYEPIRNAQKIMENLESEKERYWNWENYSLYY